MQQTSKSRAGETPSAVFISMALDMSWRLAIAVLVPIVAGAELDKHLSTSPSFVIVGLVLATLGMAFVLWQTLQTANHMPVPKLSAAKKRAIQKQYEEDDRDD